MIEENRKERLNLEIIEKIEEGMVMKGKEVK